MEDIQILEYRKEHQPWFEKLNRTWIERYFEMEEIDFEVLQDPETHIISKGGSILLAQFEKQIAGVVALKYAGPGVYEFTKMAVDERHRGKKVGLALSLAAIRKVKQMGGHSIILYSHTKLEPAIQLYKKLGFKEVPVDGPYKRSNIKMQLNLNAL